MPAPVRSTVRPFPLRRGLLDVRKFCSAARAPSVVDADAGMMVGGGKGAVYGIRIRGMPGTLCSNNCRRHLTHKDVVGETSGEARQSRMSSPAAGQIGRAGGV